MDICNSQLVRDDYIIFVEITLTIIRPTERCGQSGPMSLGVPNKQVESCFLNHNSSINFCCIDSLLMTLRGGLSLSIIIWRIGGVRPFLFPWGPKILLAALTIMISHGRMIVTSTYVFCAFHY